MNNQSMRARYRRRIMGAPGKRDDSGEQQPCARLVLLGGLAPGRMMRTDRSRARSSPTEATRAMPPGPSGSPRGRSSIRGPESRFPDALDALQRHVLSARLAAF